MQKVQPSYFPVRAGKRTAPCQPQLPPIPDQVDGGHVQLEVHALAAKQRMQQRRTAGCDVGASDDVAAHDDVGQRGARQRQ